MVRSCRLKPSAHYPQHHEYCYCTWNVSIVYNFRKDTGPGGNWVDLSTKVANVVEMEAVLSLSCKMEKLLCI